MVKLSSRDETLTHTICTGVGSVVPDIRLEHYSYTIRKDPLLSKVSKVFGDSLMELLSSEHQVLLDSGATQSESDMDVVCRMQAIQLEALQS